MADAKCSEVLRIPESKFGMVQMGEPVIYLQRALFFAAHSYFVNRTNKKLKHMPMD